VTRIAIAGAGWAGEVHAASLERVAGAKLVQIVSRTFQSAEKTAATVGVPSGIYTDLSPKVEVTVVATPATHHLEMAHLALERGRGVLIEKPLCATLAEADALIAEVERRDAVAGYAENLLFAPAVIAAIAHRGTGPLRHLSVRTGQPAPDWGHFLEPLEAGGVLFDLGCHGVALALALAGSEPVAVSADLRSDRADGADDDATARIRFADGLVGVVEASWRAERPVWDFQAAADDRVTRVELLPQVAVELDGEDATPEPTNPLADFGYVDQIDGLLGVLERRGGRVCPLGFGRLVLDVVCAAYASAGAGGDEVDLPFTGPRDRTPLQLWRG
jgi:predicted dehydrogenase